MPDERYVIDVLVTYYKCLQISQNYVVPECVARMRCDTLVKGQLKMLHTLVLSSAYDHLQFNLQMHLLELLNMKPPNSLYITFPVPGVRRFQLYQHVRWVPPDQSPPPGAATAEAAGHGAQTQHHIPAAGWWGVDDLPAPHHQPRRRGQRPPHRHQPPPARGGPTPSAGHPDDVQLLTTGIWQGAVLVKP